MRSKGLRKLGIAVTALAAAACSDTTDLGTTTSLTVLLTDAASPYVGEAMVDIGEVSLLGGPGGPVVLTDDGTDGLVNLLDLEGAVTEVLATAEIEAATYTQLRLVVEAAEVTLDGATFTDGTTTKELVVPSGAQTGLKLNLSAGDAEGTPGGVQIAPGEAVLVVDFDVGESFVLQGNPETPAGVSGVSFTPTLRVVVNDVAGSISGTVSTGIMDFTLGGLGVAAEPVEGTTLEPFQSHTANAVVADDGTYTIYFIVPGDYVVSVDAGEGFTAPSVDVTVGESEDVTDVDFVIVEG